MKKNNLGLLAGAAALLIAGCESGAGMMANNQSAAMGTSSGAIAGGVIGHQINNDNGRYVGAVTGALAGAAIGNYMNRQQQPVQQQPVQQRFPNRAY